MSMQRAECEGEERRNGRRRRLLRRLAEDPNKGDAAQSKRRAARDEALHG